MTTPATQLLDFITAAGVASVPGLPLIENAIKLLLQIPVLQPTELGSSPPDVFALLLKRLLREKGLSSDLSAENLDKLCASCFGTPNGTPTRPSNRVTLQSAGVLKVDYLWDLDAATIPGALMAKLGMANHADMILLISGAWDKWIRALKDNPKFRVQKFEGQAASANLKISFEPIPEDGVLGLTTTWGFAGNNANFKIAIDIQQDWTVPKLLTTLTHEIGHALGLEHTVGDSIMAAMIPSDFSQATDIKQIQLTPTDLAALQNQPSSWAKLNA